MILCKCSIRDYFIYGGKCDLGRNHLTKSEATMIKEADTVEETLKVLDEPTRLRDIVELTKDKVKWKPSKAQTNQMLSYMKRRPRIEKVGRGLYQLSEDKMEENGQDNMEETKKEVSKSEPVKPQIKDDDLVEMSDKDKELLDSFRSTTTVSTKQKPTYKVGDTFEGTVTGIESYGAFVCDDDERMQGLVHITNIRSGIVDDVYRHFKIGDLVTAKIVAIRPSGKLALSTIGYDLPDYFRSEELESKLEPIVEEESKLESVIEEPNKVEDEEIKTEKRYGTAKVVDNNESREVYKFIQGITGVISDEAREKIEGLIKEQGMFKFAITLAEVQKEFEVDVSMMFAQAIEEKLRDGL
jgi:predicted RNA-binding protein with RPS1 domain